VREREREKLTEGADLFSVPSQGGGMQRGGAVVARHTDVAVPFHHKHVQNTGLAKISRQVQLGRINKE
jgi:hypothetical protein